MTVTHLAQVKALSGIDAVARVILSDLADEADSAGRCAPPLKAIAARAGVSVDTVRRRLGELARAGLLRREAQRDANGSPAPALVVLTLDGARKVLSEAKAPDSERAPLADCDHPSSQDATTPLLADCDHPPSRLRPPSSQIATTLLADCEEGRAREYTNYAPARAEPLPNTVEESETNPNFSFEAFWAVYPHQPTAPPGLARKKFERLDLAARKAAIAGAEAFARDCARRKRRAGDAARWLDAEGWVPWLTRDGRPRKAAPGAVFVRQNSDAWRAWEDHHRRTGTLRPGQSMFAVWSAQNEAHGRYEASLFPPGIAPSGPGPPCDIA